MAMFRVRNALAAGIAAALALALSTAAHAATITVDSLADTGAPGICVLRDAITAANTKIATNGCIAGSGNDTINFSVAGTIALASTLPTITDGLLTINGPASPGIRIDGGNKTGVMQVASGASLDLNHLTVAHGSAQCGGGIENFGALIITNSTFSGNGDGAVCNNGALSVTSSTFSDNEASVFGGGIQNQGTTLTITNSTFSGNSAAYYGGGIFNEGTLTITNSTFSDNEASIYGGGIGNFATLTMTNSTFSGNEASFGGGIANYDGELRVTNSTFSTNSARAHGVGGGIYTYGGRGTLTSLKSTILAASTGGNCSGGITDRGYNISDDPSCGFSVTGSRNNTEPMLDPAGLSNNGGPTRTIALLSGSPAIDAIPLADCTDQAAPPNPIITDQRLFPRPDAGEVVCDIGAYEVQDSAFVHFASFAGGLRVDPDAGVFSLSGGFKLGAGGSIDPITQPVAFGVGSYAVRLPAGSFVKYKTGYVYQKKVNGVFLCLYLKFTNTPGKYILLAYRKGGSITETASLVPVTLTIGDNSGSTQMNAKFD